MIISQQKPIDKILESLKEYKKVFLVGCGECAAACKSGGEPELAKMKLDLEAHGKVVCGTCLPSAPCVVVKAKHEFDRHAAEIKDSDVILVLACGLGVQSVKEADRLEKEVLGACDTLFGAVMDAKGNFYEKCSMCGECVLDVTGGICPVTLCAKGLLNGPCGGMDKGKCEADRERDCAWILIYNALKKKNKLSNMRDIHVPRDNKKSSKPHNLLMRK